MGLADVDRAIMLQSVQFRFFLNNPTSRAGARKNGSCFLPFVRPKFSLVLQLASIARLPLGFRFRCCLRKEPNLLVALSRIAGSINWTPETKTRNKDRDDRQARIDVRFVICTLTVPRMAAELGFGDRTLLAAGLL
jgi:hypothetical protein